MKPFEDIFDVLNNARQNNDKVTLTFIKGLDNIARLQIEDSSATAGTTRYVKFYNNDVRKFTYVEHDDFEEMYAGLEMKTGKPKEETIEFPSVETGIMNALRILEQNSVLDDSDEDLSVTVRTSTLKDAHYILQYIEPAMERYFEQLDLDLEDLNHVMVDQSEELKAKIWEKFVFSQSNLEMMLADFEKATLNMFPNTPSNLIVFACSEANNAIASMLTEGVESHKVHCREELALGFIHAVSHMEQFIISIATLPYRKTELELRESREAYITEMAVNLYIFAESLSQAYTRLVYTLLTENRKELTGISEYVKSIENLAVHWVKEEALGGTMLANNEEDLVELSQALNSMSLDDLREEANTSEEEEDRNEILEMLDELFTELIDSLSESEEEEDEEDEDEEHVEDEVQFEEMFTDSLEALKKLFSASEDEEDQKVELSDDAKAEFEEYFADAISELHELRKKGESAVALYNKVHEELPLTELGTMAMKNLRFVVSALQKILNRTELDYTKKGLNESLDTLKGNRYNFFVDSVELLGDTYKLYKTAGVGIADYANAVIEDMEDTLDSVTYVDSETANFVKLAVKQIKQDIKSFESNDGYSDLLAFSLAFTLVVVMKDYNETVLSPINVKAEDFAFKNKPSVVVEEDEEEQKGAIDLAKELKDLIRGTALDTEKSLDSSVDEEALIADYKNGVSQRELVKCYNISTGKFYSILRRHGIAVDSSKVAKKVAHVEENPEVLEQVIRDYIEGKTLAYIYSNYNLYKNGLFYLLDKYQVPRRSQR